MSTRQGGFTLLELVFAIVIVYVGVAGIVAVISQTTRSSADPVVPKQAMMVAEALMEEVLAKNFANRSGGSSRVDWDDVDDYNLYASTGVRDAYGNAVVGLEKYNVAVSVIQPAATVGTVPANKVRQVTITVRVGSDAYSLTGYKFDNDCNDCND